MQWIYGLFFDLMSYCANALLGVMSTDLSFFEESVPIVVDLYTIFVAVGWGLLIGNCAFQCMKAMFAGFGFETEAPAILLLRTGLFGFLLIFSKDICEIGLSIGKNVIDLLGIPSSVTLTMSDDGMFSGLGASWLLVIIIGFILGFQLIKLFFEVAERYVVVAVLTLLCPVGLAMGGSKSTKDICTGFIRTYISMIVMMVMNVLFLKLILSALAAMPSGALVLPWCLLVVGIAKTARKADNLVSRIGLNAAATGDPLGAGKGLMTAAMITRTVMSVAGKRGGAKAGGGRTAAAMQALKHYWPQILAIALVLLLLPVIIFCCLPMMLFGFSSSTNTEISEMTDKAQTVSEYYAGYESYIDEWVEEIKSTVMSVEAQDTETSGTGTEPEQTEQIEYEVVLSGTKIQKNWFIALHAVTVGNDLNAATEADVRAFSRKCVAYMVKPADENTENETGEAKSASDEGDETKMILDIRYLTPSGIMAEAGFTDADENWARLLYKTLEGDPTEAST